MVTYAVICSIMNSFFYIIYRIVQIEDFQCLKMDFDLVRFIFSVNY